MRSFGRGQNLEAGQDQNFLDDWAISVVAEQDNAGVADSQRTDEKGAAQVGPAHVYTRGLIAPDVDASFRYPRSLCVPGSKQAGIRRR